MIAGGVSEIDLAKARYEAIGAAVRSGQVTPQIEDEHRAREELALPAINKDVIDRWEEQGGYRSPITLRERYDEKQPPTEPADEQSDD